MTMAKCPGTYPRPEFDGLADELKTVVVPFAIGRNRLKPIPIFNSKSLPPDYSGVWQSVVSLDRLQTNGQLRNVITGAVDCVLAFCQAGDATYPVTLQGVWRDKEFAGQRWDSSSGTWKAVGAAPMRALRGLMRAQDRGHWQQQGYTAVWISDNAVQSAPHELILSTAAPYGKRYVGPNDLYQDITGAYPAWGYLAGTSLEGSGFYGLAHLRAEQLALDPTFETALPPIEFLIDTYGGPEVHPVVAVRAILERVLGEPSASIETDHGPDGRVESGFQRWCDANPELRVNGVVDGTPKAAIDEILAAANAEMVQSNGKICIWPLGDAAVGSYEPAFYWSGAWHPTVIDRREVQGGIDVKLTDMAEIFNCQTVKYLDRAKDYKESTITEIHRWHAGQFGRREGQVISSKWVSTAKAANRIAQFSVRRSINQTKRLKARLAPRWYSLQVGDLLELGDGIYTGGAWTDVIGVPPTLCRIAKKSRRADDGSFEVEAWGWAYGATQPLDLTPDDPAPPVMIEPTAIAQDTRALLGLAAAQIADLASDGILSPVEKSSVMGDYSVIIAEQAGIDTQADAAGVSRSAYDSAVAALTAYLGTLTSPTEWNDAGGNTSINGPEFRSTFASVYTARQELQNAISAAIRGTASSASSIALTAQQRAQAASDGVADLVAGDVVVGRLETLGYQEDGNGNPTHGAQMTSQGATLKVAPSGIRIGAYTLDVSGTIVAAGGVEGSGGTFYVTANNASSAPSAQRVDRGSSYTPRYVLRINFASMGARAGTVTVGPGTGGSITAGTQYLPVVVGAGNWHYDSVDVGLISLGGTWQDPNSIAFAFSFTKCGAWPYQEGS